VAIVYSATERRIPHLRCCEVYALWGGDYGGKQKKYKQKKKKKKKKIQTKGRTGN